MAAKGLAVGVGRTHGNANGAELTHAVASEFDRSMNKASYVDDTPVPIIVLDCDHNIEYLNHAAASLAGSTVDSCVGLKMWDVFDSEACRNGTCIAARAMREGHTVAGNAEFVVKGRKMPIRSCVSPRYDDQNKMIGVVQVMQDTSEEARFADEISRLVQASHDGQLRERGKAEDFQGRYRDLVTEINTMLDAILLPIGEGNRILAQISDGKIDELIAQTYKGDHEKMKLAVNNVATVLQSLKNELARLTVASSDGLLAERGKPEQFQGAFSEVVGGVNQMLDAILLPIGEGNRILAQISNGKIDELIAQTYKGDHEKMKLAVNNVATVLQSLKSELVRLTVASSDGLLSERGKPEQFQGAFSEVVGGVNQMLDAILLPIGEGNRILAQISNGKIDQLIAQTYKGDHEKMKQAVNNVATVLQSLKNELARLTVASSDGLLSERGKPEKFQGAFSEVVGGVNQMLDAILLPIGEGNRILTQISNGKIDELIAQTYKGDHEKMKQSINTVGTVLQNLVKDTNMLTKAALEGKLSTRADASIHHGDFRKIVEGVNSTLDAVVGPMQDVSAVLTQLAGGDFTTLVTNKYAGDFDLLASAVNTLSKSVRSALEQIGRNVSLLASSSEELNKVSQSMGSNADETATQASVVSAAAEQVSTNVQTVATGAEEMSASIKEIAKNTAEATRVATSAVRTAEVTNVTISKLGQSSAEIGQVIKVITSIAQQTNLLALNATIEAARAGEAGKGFAVVANEVKELAKETAKATEDISRKIEAIQGDTNGAVSAISQISQVIGQISDIQTTIASAIEQQSATTNEIGRTLAEAAKGSTDISKNIGGVAEAARATTVGATDTSKSAHSLEKMAAELQTLVSQFRY
jgi:methyl-accepting chemotaxis protein